jgi:hypothetical protein
MAPDGAPTFLFENGAKRLRSHACVRRLPETEESVVNLAQCQLDTPLDLTMMDAPSNLISYTTMLLLFSILPYTTKPLISILGIDD